VPKITLMPEGINAGFAGVNGSPERRGVVRGLTPGAARRNKRWLMSIDQRSLTGIPVTFTLTLRDIPASCEEWTAAKKALLMRFRRYGFLRCHWVMEWTKRGRPHLHGIAFLPAHKGQPGRLVGRTWEVFTPALIVEWWTEVAGRWGVSPRGQHVQLSRRVDTAWLRYMAKHASRGVGHYQRQAESIPEGWKKTGHMWGTMGDDWPLHAEKHDLPTWAFHHLRRQVRRMIRAKARILVASGQPNQVKQGRAMLAYLEGLTRRPLKDGKPISVAAWVELSTRLGISEWVPFEVSVELIDGIFRNIAPPAELHRLDRLEALREAYG
jgi:hypothetical protein